MEKIYNKLVRDNIPEIIRRDNANPETRVLKKEEFRIELLKKLKEEAEEAFEAREDKKELIKEIGDIYEVIDTILEEFKLNRDEIIQLQKKRRMERGSFKRKIFLEKVKEN